MSKRKTVRPGVREISPVSIYGPWTIVFWLMNNYWKCSGLAGIMQSVSRACNCKSFIAKWKNSKVVFDALYNRPIKVTQLLQPSSSAASVLSRSEAWFDNVRSRTATISHQGIKRLACQFFVVLLHRTAISPLDSSSANDVFHMLDLKLGMRCLPSSRT